MQRGGGGIGGAAERGEASGFGQNLRGLVGRWPDADVVLQGGMSDGLRDWDLWYVTSVLFLWSVWAFRLMMCFSKGAVGLLLGAELVLVCRQG